MDSSPSQAPSNLPWMQPAPEVASPTSPQPGQREQPVPPDAAAEGEVPRTWRPGSLQPTEGMKHLPQDVRDAMLARKRQTMERLDPWGDVVQKRARICAVTWAVLCPLMVLVVVGATWLCLGVAFVLGGIAGYWTGMRRSTPSEHGLVIAAVCMLSQAIGGSMSVNFMLIFSSICFGVIGAIGGVHHQLRASDGQ